MFHPSSLTHDLAAARRADVARRARRVRLVRPRPDRRTP